MANADHLHSELRERVELFLGVKMQTRRHFDALAEAIFVHTKEMVSATTLRRYWGYQDKDAIQPSANTLNLLCRLVGFEDWDAFTAFARKNTSISSQLMQDMRTLSVSTLVVGCNLQVTWNPNRRVLLEYLGQDTFRVTENENSQLQEGDTFVCHQIVMGQVMCCESLLRPGHGMMSYVCGKSGGLSYRVIK